MKIDEKSINSLRFTAVNMIELANSGHPGIALDIAPLIYVLYTRHMNVVPSEPNNVMRDRLVLSAGHASSILYATLSAVGYKISEKDLKEFRKLGSITPGHPEIGITPGVDCSAGPLGQGVAEAVGLALAEKMMAERFNIDECKFFDNYTYCIAGDGCMMEGVSYEALSLAGALKLNKLIVFYDRNKITIDGNISRVYDVDVKKYMQALGFDVLEVEDGNNVSQIDDAISSAKLSKEKPVFVILNTKIGYGSELEGQCKVHGTPLGTQGIAYLKDKLNITCQPFKYEDDVKKHFKDCKKRYDKIKAIFDERVKFYKKNCKNVYDEIQNFLNPNFDNLYEILKGFKSEKTDASTREWGGEILKEIARNYSCVVGGTADVASSTKARINKEVVNDSMKNRDINYGIREFGMSAISNGLALYGFRPFCSTFFAFSDYMKNGIRMSALMDLPVNYIFTHDSYMVGEDGPTHQPIEQLATLRAMPNINVFRPCDFTETCACYYMAYKNACPSAMILTRQKLPMLTSSFDGAIKGAYIIKQEKEKLDLIFIATGSEVSLAIASAEKLEKRGFGVRVVSMPCMKIFDKQTEKYKNNILPENVKKVSIEAGSTFGWDKYVNVGMKIGMDCFGMSGNGSNLSEKYGFNVKNICDIANKLLKSE